MALASTGWIGRCTLGFSWTQGHRQNNLKMTLSTLPLVQEICSLLVQQFSSYFVPSIGLACVISHIEGLRKFTQQILNDSNQAISLLNSEILCCFRAYAALSDPLPSLDNIF